MSDIIPSPPERVPTLTEVVTWPESVAPELAAGSASVQEPLEADLLSGEAPAAAALVLNEDQTVERVLVELQRQIDLMVEYRLREVLTPMIARMTDNLVREARSELASTLREVVARAVSQEIARHRIG